MEDQEKPRSARSYRGSKLPRLCRATARRILSSPARLSLKPLRHLTNLRPGSASPRPNRSEGDSQTSPHKKQTPPTALSDPNPTSSNNNTLDDISLEQDVSLQSHTNSQINDEKATVDEKLETAHEPSVPASSRSYCYENPSVERDTTSDMQVADVPIRSSSKTSFGEGDETISPLIQSSDFGKHTTGLGSGRLLRKCVSARSCSIDLPHRGSEIHLKHKAGNQSLHPRDSARSMGSSLKLTRKHSVLFRSQEGPFKHGEEQIVTPFAQILASLRNVRNNYIAITNLQSSSAANKPKRKYSTVLPADIDKPEDQMKLATETLEELDWCLEQLETIQTHQSVSHMASTKFQRMLGKELSQLGESKSGHQLSQFIFDNFVDKDQDLDVPALQDGTDGDANDSYPQDKNVSQSIAATRVINVRQRKISRVSGPQTDGTELPKYGVVTPNLAQLTPYMEQLDTWGVDVFQISNYSNGKPLSAILFSLLNERGLIESFGLNPQIILRYCRRVEDHYHSNPYHNAIHGADVAQSVHVLLNSEQLSNVFTDLEVLAAIFASAVHDVDHPGVTNQFLINSGNELAILYNDESVLEQHHLAVAFKLLQEPDCDMFAPLSKKQRHMLRKISIDMVLATDMSKHMNLLADLKTTVESKKVSGSGVLLLDNYNDRIQVLQNMIHLADLSNPTKPLEIYQEWTNRIMQEYWNQGAKEKSLGLDVSAMCDKETATVESSQVGFIDFIVYPLWETWADLVYPDATEMLDNLTENCEWYRSRIPQPKDAVSDTDSVNEASTLPLDSGSHSPTS